MSFVGTRIDLPPPASRRTNRAICSDPRTASRHAAAPPWGLRQPQVPFDREHTGSVARWGRLARWCTLAEPGPERRRAGRGRWAHDRPEVPCRNDSEVVVVLGLLDQRVDPRP
jgi:hypothetical protein